MKKFLYIFDMRWNVFDISLVLIQDNDLAQIQKTHKQVSINTIHEKWNGIKA